GGVLIKLGQFLSTRVDILPPEITRELTGLQDEVPPGAFAGIARQIEEDFGRPLSEVFAWIATDTIGAASLAQVHRARLPDGREAVVKVLRPGIDVLVETDLAAARLALRLLKFSQTIRRRVNLDRLAVEITETTRAELDLQAEGRNAERFAANFAGDSRVYLPKIFWEWSARRTLTLEDVGWSRSPISRRSTAPASAAPRWRAISTASISARSSSTSSCTPIRIRATSSSVRCRSAASVRSRRATRRRRRRKERRGPSRSPSSTSAWWPSSPSGCAARCASTRSDSARATRRGWSIPTSPPACCCRGPTCGAWRRSMRSSSRASGE